MPMDQMMTSAYWYHLLTNDWLTLVLLIVCLILIGMMLNMSRRITLLTRGENGASLEHSIRAIEAGLKEEQAFKKDMRTYLTDVERRLRQGVRGIGLVRFNAFQGTATGGLQSFALTELSEEGNGIIISTITVRERVSVFCKPIKKFNADRELTPEEMESLMEAKKSLSNAAGTASAAR